MRSFRNGVRMAFIGLLVATALAGCGKSNKKTSSTSAKGGSITIAGSDFEEQDIVANIYAVALRAKGLTVTVKPHLGKREVVQPALQSGQVDLLPEYAASLSEYLKAGSSSGDINAEITNLKSLLQPKGLTVLDPAGAYDANALVVTKATADKWHLTKISDLAPIASQLTFGGPPECPTRPKCLVGLKGTYGLNFKTFKPLDVAGPITKKALTDGSVDVALLLSSDVPENTVVLQDDKQLQGAENLIPVIRTAKNDATVTATLNAVSKALTLDELIDLNRKAAGPDKPDASKLAEDWAKEYKLAS